MNIVLLLILSATMNRHLKRQFLNSWERVAFGILHFLVLLVLVETGCKGFDNLRPKVEGISMQGVIQRRAELGACFQFY